MSFNDLLDGGSVLFKVVFLRYLGLCLVLHSNFDIFF